MKHLSRSALQTRTLGKQFARTLRGGDVVCLEGDLGAGKTTFVKGLALGLGINKTISSPTFILFRPYAIAPALIDQVHAAWLVHVDCYRLDAAEQLRDAGLFEYLGQPDVITVIEWPERMQKALPARRVVVQFKHPPAQASHRQLSITRFGS